MPNKKWPSFLLLILILPNFGCAVKEKLYYVAPSALQFTTRAMKTSGFWISLHPQADQLILTKEETKAFNDRIVQELKLNRDMSEFPYEYSKEEIRGALSQPLEEIKGKNYYLSSGEKAAEVFFKDIEDNLRLEDIPHQIEVKFGLIVHYANQRILPTDEILTQIPYDIDFDELQNSALDVGTAVSILHETKDKEWYYTESELTSGWVKKEDIALCSKDELNRFLKQPLFAVVIKPKADIFLNQQMLDYYDYVRMGVKLPLIATLDRDSVEVTIPTRNSEGKVLFRDGYVRAKDVHAGFLPFTARTILEEAFEMLNEPYGWGGMYGEQDCSRFLQEVFATVGISLPRNSSSQAKVGKVLAQFNENTPPEEKYNMLKTKGVGGLTFLPMKGHIMLYLGMVDERLFAIHAPWGYREPAGGKDRVRVINRVVVSDLSLGEGSKKGSLLNRINKVILLDNL